MGTHLEFEDISFDFHVLTTQGHHCKIHRQELDKYLKYIGIGAGVDERDGFEIRCTCKGTQGSNPCLSATVPP